ncbi:hypothetical protein F4861DRAFT_482652 [Xylaria intraflava]|nr:hypothetical protein F4861DRAFT_482652 [Xylaria intraflava]
MYEYIDPLLMANSVPTDDSSHLPEEQWQRTFPIDPSLESPYPEGPLLGVDPEAPAYTEEPLGAYPEEPSGVDPEEQLGAYPEKPSVVDPQELQRAYPEEPSGVDQEEPQGVDPESSLELDLERLRALDDVYLPNIETPEPPSVPLTLGPMTADQAIRSRRYEPLKPQAPSVHSMKLRARRARRRTKQYTRTAAETPLIDDLDFSDSDEENVDTEKGFRMLRELRPMGLAGASALQPLTETFESNARTAAAIRRPKSIKRPRGPLPSISAPLSKLAGDYPEFYPLDMMRHVRRGAAERRLRTGEIAAPANSFLLYRKAYSTLVRPAFGVAKVQEMSRILSASWRMEAPEIRERFYDLAKVDVATHRKLFPRKEFNYNQRTKGSSAQ